MRATRVDPLTKEERTAVEALKHDAMLRNVRFDDRDVLPLHQRKNEQKVVVEINDEELTSSELIQRAEKLKRTVH